MASPVLGIDLGTTNSVVAHADATRVRVLRDEQGHLLMPSCVSFLEGGETRVGHAARELRLLDAEHTVFSVKRLIGRPFSSPEVKRALQRLPFKLEEGPTGGVMVNVRGEQFSLPEISSFILRRLRDVAERSLGVGCTNAVITVPANFNELQRMATRDAGRIAGLNVLRILNEPTAAALAYGYRAEQRQRIAVYDFGGGTFDISILELSGDVIEVVATAGDTHLGGDDFDRVLADRMVADFQVKYGIDLKQASQQYERITMAAEWLKCQLAELDAAEATIKEVATDGRDKLDLQFRISRGELHELVSPLIGRTFAICEEALKLANVRPSQLDGVLLVGGQTRTPRVREMVAEYFGMQPKYSVDPDLAVAQGAALQGYALSGVPAAQPDRQVVRTLAGAASVPPSKSDPFQDEPTRIADEDNPFDDAPTTLAPQPRQRPVHPALAYGPPSVRPEKPSVLHASTLSGVGAPAQAPPPAGASPFRTHAETPGAKGKGGRTKSDSGARRSPAPPPMAADEPEVEIDLPAVLQVEAANDDDNVATTMLESPKAKARSRGAVIPDSRRKLEEAQRLAAEGQLERALSLYGELLIRDPNDPLLLRETRALRARLTATSPSAAALRAGTPGSGLSLPPASGMSALPPSAAAPSGFPASSLADSGARTKLAESGARATAPELQDSSSFSVAPPSAAVPSAPPSARGTALLGSPSALALPLTAAGTLLESRPAARVSAKPPPPPPPKNRRTPKPADPVTQERASVRPPQLSPVDDGAARARANDNAGQHVIARPRQDSSQFPRPPSVAPLLLDVTPHTLSVETVGGFCEPIISRNAPIPTEQTRVFTTSRDNQVTVSVRVCQGESRRIDDNQVLGQIDLLGLRQARRGDVSIAVTFVLDVDGTLNVRALDEGTGYGQELEVNLTGAIDTRELERVRARVRAMTG